MVRVWMASPSIVRRARLLLACGFWVSLAAIAVTSEAKEAQWIWHPEHEKENVPEGSCFFRKTIEGPEIEAGQITITADDRYELYVNGRLVGRGGSQKKLDEYDITRYLHRDSANTVAVRVDNERGKTAALAARVMIKDLDGPWRSYSTDSSWLANTRPLPLWNSTIYNDRRWPVAQSFGELGETAPWDRNEEVPVEEREKSERFQISDEFDVRRVVESEITGSLIAFTFNEFGHIIASQENGPLLLIHGDSETGTWGEARTYCDKVRSCQGILALNGDVYVTADGPDGQGFYRLTDRDRDGVLEEIKTLMKFDGSMGEHGAHGIVLGPDGWIYVILGNHTAVAEGYADTSPHRNFYEGDLIQPRYEDPSGHANGIKAPGGVVIRTDLDGKTIEMVCGGIRNAYDLVFNREGDLFVHDSDMESDIGAPWYRPTQVFHAIAGGEYGWRSGWAKWPSYFIDGLPPVVETGRGSPTGGVVYDHHMFPRRYHNALFLADWSEGRILAVQLKPNGASYTGDAEVFLSGSPLNVTDVEVGPEGALYFITGGRGTSGGVYRVTWRGTVPPAVQNLGQGISRAIRHPQPQSAWARQNIALLKEELDGQWSKLLVGVASSTVNPPNYRTRALDLMQLFGPPPSHDLLVQLSEDKSEQVRAKVADLMGLHSNRETQQALIKLLDDGDRAVRRKACEALCRSDETVPIDKLMTMLASDDRYEAWAARRLLERTPVDEWQEEILSTDNTRLFIQGSLALMIANPDHDLGFAILVRMSELMRGFVSDRDFVDMLRVAQVTLQRGEIAPDEVPELRTMLADEFPAGNGLMNREIMRLLAYLQATEPMERYFEYLDSDVPETEKLHVALHLRYLEDGWTTDRKLQLLSYYEQAQDVEGGGSYSFYIRYFERDFAKNLSAEESLEVIESGHRWPSAALGALYKLPEELDDPLRDKLMKLDHRLTSEDKESVKALRVGIIAILARSGDEKSMAYLRSIWDNEPERRQAVAMGLAQSPDGENWSYLVRSIPILEGGAVREVLQKLLDVAKAPAEAEYIRQVILAGLKLKENGGEDACALLEYWTGEQPSDAESEVPERLAAWQTWFAEKYPEQPEAQLPVAKDGSKWKLEELMQYLSSEDASKASVERGAAVFTKAQCSKCHRFGTQGESLGPDLTSLSSRFMRREALESILFPSHVISDQYASKNVVTTDGKKYTGVVVTNDDSITILQTNGEKIELRSDDVEEMQTSRTSIMAEGLLDPLTLEEIADLFAYLGYNQPAEVARRAIGGQR